jgi:hypothetical protein
VHELSHCTSSVCAVSAERAFGFLADPAQLGRWVLGCWGGTLVEADTVRGTSLFDGETTVVKVIGRRESLTVDFLVEGDGGAIVPRISARVVPGPVVGRDASECLVTLLAWRTESMTDERWRRLAAVHEAEILLLGAQLEAGATARPTC